MDPREVLADLKRGNERYASSTAKYPLQLAEQRRVTAAGQKPKAAILGCADSRVPPELIFDQGLGGLFVVRVAGNVLDNLVLGSLEYAVAHLGVPLIVVLGHSRCGAVTAALSEDIAEGSMQGLLAAIELGKANPGDSTAKAITRATCANLKHVAAGIRASGSHFSDRIAAGELEVIEAFYDLVSGRVEFKPGICQEDS
jgi:carbonic anhydrase